MCGICGYVGRKLIQSEQLAKMNDTMYHRGPDDHGIWERQKEEYGVGFAQRRLSILDLSEMGHQPMTSEDGSVVITYNGEIYNYIQLRNELKGEGYQFKSNCDTEVIIAAYQEWGCECFGKFNGMFAIAIYDEKKESIILARDRMGKKPLYYYKKGGHYYVEGKNIAGQAWHMGFITCSSSSACSYIMECEYMLLVYTGTGKTAR